MWPARDSTSTSTMSSTSTCPGTSRVMCIGLAGRAGQAGRDKAPLSSTGIIKSTRTQELSILLDLKYLLKEAKQNIPPFLKMLKSEGKMECGFCGGLGHR